MTKIYYQGEVVSLIQPQPPLQWYAVRIATRQRRLKHRHPDEPERQPFTTQHLLECQGFATFMPRYSVFRQRSKYRRLKEARFYPLLVGWIFVGWTLGMNRWRELFDTAGVVAVAGANGQPYRLTQERIDELMRKWEPQRYAAHKREKWMRTYREYAPGDTVKLVDAPFDGFEGRVVAVKGRHARVLLNLLGVEREVTVDAMSVVAA